MTEKDFDDIERYLTEKLSPEEVQRFKLRLEFDDEFKKLVDVYSSLHRGILHYGRMELKEKIFPSTQSPFFERLPTRWKLAIPIVAFAILLLTYRLIFPLENEALFREYYAKIDSIHLAIPRGEAEAYQIKLKAFDYYKANLYDSALRALSETDSTDSESHFLKGVIYLQMSKWSEAEKALKKVTEALPSMTTDAHWYLAMIYLRQNEKPSAMRELEFLIQQKSPYQLKAAELIEKLK